MAVYPFTRLEEERRRLLAAGVEVIDFGKGDPNEPTDPMIRDALVEALPARAPYPLAQGLPELRGAAEAYTELWVDEPPPSALQAADRSRTVVFQTLSKRSSMTGYRSGFVAAPAEIVAALKSYRPTVGTAPQEFVQRASVVAWNDERHVEDTRARYRAKRDVLIPAVEGRGWEILASEATMYLWVVGPDPEALLERGIIVSPGEMFGPSGAGYVRFALVPTLEECERAAEILREV